MKSLLAVFISCAISAVAAGPNIIFIIADDLGYGDLSCYGQKHFETPHLDKLAADGVRFTSHYSGSTVCAPSRCALMTGRHTGHGSIRGNGPFALRPDPDDLTVATLLQRAGYSTGLIGKSCVTGNTQTPEILAQKGFQYFYGTTHHGDGHFRNPRFVYENTRRIELEGNTLYDGPHYDVDLYTGKALEFVERHSDKPFFLVLSYPVPHASLDVPEDSLGKVRAGITDEKSFAGAKKLHYKPAKEVKATYAGMVSRLDDAVGLLMAKLKEKGIDENTLVVFTSDNGSHMEGGYDYSMLQSNGVLRGGKRDLYEGGIRVPFVARWPLGVTAGRVTHHASAFWDFLPTVCELAGIENPPKLDGVSYAAALTGKGEPVGNSTLYWEFHESGGRRALRIGDWKIVQYGLQPEKMGDFELYNLNDDLPESRDLAKSEPERVREMALRMYEARTRSERFPHAGLDTLQR
jgi:arylsulfatase A